MKYQYLILLDISSGAIYLRGNETSIYHASLVALRVLFWVYIEMMEKDSRLESPKRPTRLEILPAIPDNASTPRVRRPLFNATKFDEGRRRSFDGVDDSQLPMLPELGLVAKKNMAVLDSPLRLGTRALRRWSSAKVMAGCGDIRPNQSPTRPTPRFRRVSSMPNGDQTNPTTQTGSSLAMGDFLMTTPPRNYAKHRMNIPQVDHTEWQYRANCSLPLITVTPHGVSTNDRSVLYALTVV